LIEDHLSTTYADRLFRQYPANSASTTDYPAPTSIPRVVFSFSIDIGDRSSYKIFIHANVQSFFNEDLPKPERVFARR
jgi:hypothetical protein